MDSIEEVVNLVTKKSGLSKEELLLKIKDKQRELSGLVSEEGAAYIVANELGIKIRNKTLETNLNIDDIMPEMKSVTVIGKVKKIGGVREFNRNGREGKVGNLEIFDKTGSIKISLWNMSDIEKIEMNEIKEGDIVQIKNGYIRPGFQGGLDINIGNRGMLVLDPEEAEEMEFPETAPVSSSTSRQSGEVESVPQIKMSDIQAQKPAKIV